VLEEAVLEHAPLPEPADRQPDGRPGVLAISARTGQALTDLAEAHVRRLPGVSGASWDDYVGTATARRQHHREHRVAIVARDAGEAADRLRAVLESPLPTRTVIADGDPGPVFTFCGQGSQWRGMGLELLREPAFAAAFGECEQAIGDQAGWSVRAALDEENLLTDTGLAQPTVFALQVSLAALWRDWGVQPGAVIGHSMGEIAAAHVAGVLSLSDASRIITHRGRLLRAARGLGLMAAVEQPEAELSVRIARFGTALTISAVNSPAACVVSGEPAAVRELLEELKRDGIPARLMPGEYAFHTPSLAPFRQQLEELLDDLPAGQATIPILSTTPGHTGHFDDAHWGRNITEPVRFAGAVAELLARGHRSFLELGPHPVLGKPIAQCLDSAGASGVVISSLRRDNDAQLTCRTALASLYAAGYPVNWDAVGPPNSRAAKIPLYPWQNQRFWFDGARGDATDPVPAPAPATPQLSEREADPQAEDPPMPAPELQRLITGLVAGLLGVPASDVRQETGFAELGMDSLLSVELRRQLSTAVGVTLPVTAVFDHPSVQRLATHVGARLAERSKAVEVSGAESASHHDVTDRSAEPIAVIGLGCRFPGGAHGPDRFWQLLTAGTDAITEAPPGRFTGSTIWRGGFLDGVDEFDARFFRIPPREAKVMDPQQRLFLETAWEALEHAGQAADRLLGSKLSVFVGMNSTDYTQLVTATTGGVDAFFGTGNSFCAVPGRLSHLLGVHGPSLAVDTACSSSLVAIHLACQSLRRGESDMAVAGGVNVIVQDTIFRASAASGALAADGRCKTFAASADGYARGEGCGVVVLKPLSAARADGDDILAVILGSAVNQDGPSSGLTVPYGPAQQQLLRDALADAGVQPDEIGYVEAHGTGTRLGDPIELQALGTALAPPPGTVAHRFLVGSVKTNIGHLEAAAGVAGFIKTVLALRHGVIPPHLHFDEPSPDIAWQDLPIDVPTAPTPWPTDRPRRVAGVSAFGFSGTNAHLVLAGAPEPEAAPLPRSAASRKLLLLTAIAEAHWKPGCPQSATCATRPLPGGQGMTISWPSWAVTAQNSPSDCGRTSPV
jgi:acyl transferase domain-containing protein